MAKRYNEEQKISDVLKAFIQENKLEKGINKVDAKEAWVKLMGNGVNNYTQNVELRNQVLYVSLSSSVLREELSMGKSKIVKMLNEELGQELIKKIVLK
ncbi:RNA-binding protein [Croceivirga radicis]|uniref:RNA-binding protein n=1 Tax=Croceivirga radicis TaxID=1929488 RepID=A0A1V6LQ59_9FLAO|nr:DUF721 domain-containing protein [Croceivirga radicis]OQD42313.1 RNA-binding protein [Croceivirga radicis]